MSNFTTTQNEYFNALRQYIKGWSDEQLVRELNALEKVWEHDEFSDSFFLSDTNIEQILVDEVVERFKTSALSPKGV